MKTIGTGGIAGGPVDAGPIDLPTEPRTTDLDAYRASIESKRQQRRTQISTLLLAGRPTLTTPAPPVPEPDDDEPDVDEEPLVWDRDEDDDEPMPADDAPQPDDDTDPTPPPRRGRPVRVLTSDEVERVVTAYVAGQGITTIARDTHLGVERIKAVLRDAGVALRPLGREGQRIAAQQRGEEVPTRRRAAPPTAEAVARMAAAYYRGDSLAAIAQREHINRDRLRDALVAAGVKIREKGSKPPHPAVAPEAPATDEAPVDVAEQEPPVEDVPAGGPGEQVSVEDAVCAGVPPLLAAEAVATVALDREDGTQVIGDPVDVEDAADTSDLDFAMTDWGWFPTPTPTTTLLLSGPLDVGDGGRDYPRRGRHRADVDHATPPGDFLLALAAFIRDAEHLLEQGRRLQASLADPKPKELTQ